MPTNTLNPDVDQRLAGWIKIQKGLKKKDEENKNVTITIARKYGCEAFPLAMAIKTIMEEKTGQNWTIFDRALIDAISKEENISQSILADIDNDAAHLDWISTFMPNYQSHTDTFKYVVRFITKVAKEGNAIIVGRGGVAITRHLKNCFHYRLDAPMEYRVQSIASRMNIDIQEAERQVRDNQTSREKFLEDFLGFNSNEIDNYHAVFNDSRHSSGELAKMISDFCLHRIEMNSMEE